MSDKEPAGTLPREVRVRAVPAVTRAIAILRLLGGRKQGLGVKAIADELGLVPSTCLHILRVLVAENLVRIEPGSKRHVLGSGMVSLARSVLEGAGFASLAQPALDRLSQRYGITAMGAEVTGRGTILVLAVARPDHPLQLHADVGSEFPALTSATGRLVAALGGEGEESLRGRFPGIDWDKPLSAEQWLGEVEQARLSGWSVDRNTFKNGITAFAAPVVGRSGAMTHSLVVMGLSAAMEGLDEAALVADLKAAASAVSVDLASA